MQTVHPPDEAQKMAELLFEDVFGITKTRRLTDADKPFAEFQRLEHLLDRLSTGEPYQHILGYTVFCHKRILVSRSVLIPRPETEELFYWMSSRIHHSPRVIADICTGSGCLAIALRDHFPDSKVIACDVSIDALNKAILSERLNFISNQIEWKQTDILSDNWQSDWPQVIVSNPPYILEEESESMSETVLKYEPSIALFAGGHDPLVFYKRIIDLFHIDPVPEIYFELNPLTAEELRTYCSDKGLQVELGRDMSGKLRFARIYA